MNLILSSEKFNQPPIYGSCRLIVSGMWIDSFLINVIPKLKMGMPFVGLDELFKHRR